MSKAAPVLAVIAAILACLLLSPRPALAAISPDPCPGNVCTGEMTIGTSTVKYYFTEHVNPDGQFKIRINGGEYDTTDMISYIVFDLPPFVSGDKYAGPGAVYLTGEEINPGRTAYERRETGGLSGKTVDQVMSVQYSGLADDEYAFNLMVIQNGGSASKNNLKFYVHSGVSEPYFAAPGNDDETDSLELINDPTPCADRDPPGNGGISIDNDLNYKANCADPVCDGQQGDPIDDALKCEIVEQACYDEFDNDADGDLDCADLSCNGEIGRQAVGGKTLAYCQYGNEYGVPLSLSGTSPCDDNFDNDADGREDCYDNLYADTGTGVQTAYDTMTDALTQSNICWRHSSYSCPTAETSCTDAEDNDIDESYSDNEFEYTVDGDGNRVPMVPSSGIDCQDYDCAGDSYCPTAENDKVEDGVHTVENCQCFDQVDNDLDHQKNCRDPDCSGAYCAGTGQECVDSEFSLASRVQMCTNEFDDDGDEVTDCQDPDCAQKFGNCGPCPSREDVYYTSCSDLRDNDVNGGTDCADAKCAGKLGSTEDAAYCADQDGASEVDSVLYPKLCFDGLDNDGDGEADCADAGCDGAASRPSGPACESAAEQSCDDNFDNDSDGKTDCLDPDCAGRGLCNAAGWDAGAACVEIGKMSDLKTFTNNDPTVSAQSFEAVHVNGTDGVRIKGVSTYSSLTVFFGDNNDVNKVYPYAAATGCELADTQPGGDQAVKMDIMVTEFGGGIPGGVLMLYNKTGESVSDFDVTVSCPTPEDPAVLKNYPISISVLRAGDIPEYGEANFQTRLYETTPPSVSMIEVAQYNDVDVPYGGNVTFRVIPSDTGSPPLDSSGICQCRVDLGTGEEYPSLTGDCLVTPDVAFYEDNVDGSPAGTLRVTATAVDGAGNVSGGYMRDLNVNVTPAVSTELTVLPLNQPGGEGVPPDVGKPFFSKSPTANKMSVNASFTTGTTDSFGSNCLLYVRNSAGAIMDGPLPRNIPNLNPPAPNTAYCVGSEISLPTTLLDPGDTDGIYFVSMGIGDDDGNSAETKRQPLFMCDTVPGSGADPDDGDVCHWADFDSDGYSEGFFTTLYSSEPKACDNCVNFYNPEQSDPDASGIGAECKSDLVGRCEIDKDINCFYHSYGYVDPDPEVSVCPGEKCCPDADEPDCCPTPAVSDPAETQQSCKSPWGVCSSGGEICFTAEDCPERGLCNNGPPEDDPLLCNSDDDCIAGEVEEGSCVGYDLCANLMYPWVQTPGGNVFSGQFIRAPEPPPPGRSNATFCITAKEGIGSVPDPEAPPPDPEHPEIPAIKYVFTSAQCGLPMTKPTSRLERPTARNVYSTVLGRLDLSGLLAGDYGDVVEVNDASDFANDYLNNSYLDDKIYVVNGDLHIGTRTEEEPPTVTLADAPPGKSGAGTVLVMSGNLYLWENVAYSQILSGGITELQRLPSIGWIVLDESNPRNPGYNTKGNVFIGKTVSDLSGAFFVGGQGGVYTVAPPDIDSSVALTIRGLMIARQFHFSRSFKSSVRGSEQVIYDGRAIANPPPGFGDVNKTLPYFGESSVPQ